MLTATNAVERRLRSFITSEAQRRGIDQRKSFQHSSRRGRHKLKYHEPHGHEYTGLIKQCNIPSGHSCCTLPGRITVMVLARPEGEAVRRTVHVLDKLALSFHIFPQGARSLGAV
jgi:hypothetical protein